jgi:hypothetical protein
MVLRQVRTGVWIAAFNRAEQILGLVLQLIEIGMDRKALAGRNEPP